MVEAQIAFDILLVLASLASAFGTLVAAVYAAKAANESRRASEEARIIAEGNLVSHFLEEYSKPEMFNSLKTLADWKKETKENFVTKWQILKNQNMGKYDEINLARRHVSHYFQRAYRLYKSGFVKKRFMKIIGELDGINILYDIVVPLESGYFKDYNKEIFEKIENVCGRPGTGIVRDLE